MSARLERSFRQLNELYERLDERLALEDRVLFETALSTSSWSIADHLFHVVLANESIFDVIDRLCQGKDYPEGKRGLSILGRVVMWSGWIPRGRGKAPNSMRPPPEADRSTLAAKLVETRETLSALSNRRVELPVARGTASHRVFGAMKASQWLDYAYVHSMHHVKIMRDIERDLQANR